MANLVQLLDPFRSPITASDTGGDQGGVQKWYGERYKVMSLLLANQNEVILGTERGAGGFQYKEGIDPLLVADFSKLI